MSKELMERDLINEKYTWDIESMFKNEKEWQDEYLEVQKLNEDFKRYRGRLGENSSTFLSALKDQEVIYRKLQNLYSYASMNLDVDTRQAKAQELDSKALNLYTEVSEAGSYFNPEILKLGEEKIEEFLKENSDLKIYRHYFNDLFREKNHILSAEKEEILAKVGEITEGFEQTYSMLNNADLKFPTILDENQNKVKLTHGNFIPFLESKDRRVRKDAYEAYYKVYLDHSNTLAATLNGELKANIFNAQIRNYDSSRQASLSKNNIPERVYDNLIQSVHDNLDSMYKYMDIRKKALKLDKLEMYDIYTPIVKESSLQYSYEEGVDLIQEALKPLGKEYMDIMLEGFNSRWIDVYETKGKRSGAYSGGSYDSKPFILLNYQETLDNVFTIAHEMGHSMHSYLTRKYQPFIYGNYSIFLAEVASTTNELLLLNYMLENTKSEKDSLALINHYLESFRSTVFRQTMFAEFEMKINKYLEDGGVLTSEYLSKTYRDLNQLYYGENVNSDENISIEWARIPHFYYNFYVFQYATGFSAAVDFSQKILKGGQEEVDKYLDFLKSGSSDYSIDILRTAGVDMTTKEPVENAMEVFKGLVDKLDKLI